MTYDIKCDICKKVIGQTNKVEESYKGGLCPRCRFAGTHGSLLSAMEKRDNKLIREIERRAKKGEIVRII